MKPNSGKKATLIMKGLLGNLETTLTYRTLLLCRFLI